MFKANIFLKKNVKISETNISKKRKQHHDAFITEAEKFYEGISNEFYKRRTGAVKTKPILSTIIVRDLCEIEL